MKKKLLFTSIMSVILCFSLICGATFALFTSESKVNIAVTSGKVEVIATVKNYEYSYDTGLSENVDIEIGENEDGTYSISKMLPGDAVNFNVEVVNNSNVSIKYQVETAISGELAEYLEVEIKEGETVVSNNAKTSWKTITAKEDIEDITVKVELPYEETNGMDQTANISITVTAVQGNAIVPQPVKVNSEISYDDFETLMTSGGNIYLTEDITVGNPENSRFTEFELNGDVGIYAAENATLKFSETTTLVGKGTLTIYGGAIDEIQELCVSDNATLVIEDGIHSFAALSASGNGKIIVNGGTLNCKGTYGSIMGITFGENGSLIVNDGTLNMYQPFNLNPNRCDNAYIEINGGTIDLLNNIENLFVVRNVMNKDNESGVLRGSSIRVKGGTFIAHYEIDSAGDATSFIRNGDSPADGNKVLVDATDKYDCVVTGGTFYGSWQRADNQRYTDGNGGYSDGLFVENSIAGFVADGYEIIGDATNGYIVSAK